MRILLPAWHELYEQTKREAFEKAEPNTKKRVVKNELIYSANELKNASNCVEELPKKEKKKQKVSKNPCRRK